MNLFSVVATISNGQPKPNYSPRMRRSIDSTLCKWEPWRENSRTWNHKHQQVFWWTAKSLLVGNAHVFPKAFGSPPDIIASEREIFKWAGERVMEGFQLPRRILDYFKWHKSALRQTQGSGLA